MTKLMKSELIEIGQVLVLANTPLSLIKGLRGSSVMRKFRQGWSKGELLAYYDHLTARPEQSEIVVALSYALLIAMVLRGQPADPSRLRWGELLQEYLTRSGANTEFSTVNAPTPQPTVQSSSVAGSSVLYGPDNRPIDLAERLRP